MKRSTIGLITLIPMCVKFNPVLSVKHTRPGLTPWEDTAVIAPDLGLGAP